MTGQVHTMSMNLALHGYGTISPQTTTTTSHRLLALGGTDAIAQAVIQYRHEQLDPPALQGKDARNLYKIQEREDRIAEIAVEDQRMLDFIRTHPTAKFYIR